jgi:hypothetical protein
MTPWAGSRGPNGSGWARGRRRGRRQRGTLAAGASRHARRRGPPARSPRPRGPSAGSARHRRRGAFFCRPGPAGRPNFGIEGRVSRGRGRARGSRRDSENEGFVPLRTVTPCPWNETVAMRRQGATTGRGGAKVARNRRFGPLLTQPQLAAGASSRTPREMSAPLTPARRPRSPQRAAPPGRRAAPPGPVRGPACPRVAPALPARPVAPHRRTV